MIADGATVTIRNVDFSGNLNYIVGTLGHATIVLPSRLPNKEHPPPQQKKRDPAASLLFVP